MSKLGISLPVIVRTFQEDQEPMATVSLEVFLDGIWQAMEFLFPVVEAIALGLRHVDDCVEDSQIIYCRACVTVERREAWDAHEQVNDTEPVFACYWHRNIGDYPVAQSSCYYCWRYSTKEWLDNHFAGQAQEDINNYLWSQVANPADEPFDACFGSPMDDYVAKPQRSRKKYRSCGKNTCHSRSCTKHAHVDYEDVNDAWRYYRHERNMQRYEDAIRDFKSTVESIA